jgi:hypothetical protein
MPIVSIMVADRRTLQARSWLDLAVQVSLPRQISRRVPHRQATERVSSYSRSSYGRLPNDQLVDAVPGYSARESTS